MTEQNTEDTLLEFPCEFPIKAMGLDENAFDKLVLGIIHKHIKTFPDNAVSTRKSSNGKYLSVTVTVIAESKKQLDAVYIDLSAHHRVIMAL